MVDAIGSIAQSSLTIRSCDTPDSSAASGWDFVIISEVFGLPVSGRLMFLAADEVIVREADVRAGCLTANVGSVALGLGRSFVTASDRGVLVDAKQQMQTSSPADLL